MLPVLACLGGMFFFGAMDTAMKAVTIDIGVVAALFWRCAIGSVIAIVLYAARRGPLPGHALIRLHLLRGSVVAAMALLFFWGLARTPMAEAIAISFIAPIIALFLAAILLGETIGRNAIYASLLGLAGVLVIAGSRLGLFGGGDSGASTASLPGILAITGSAVLYAWNLVLQRQQAQIASPQEIALSQNLIVCFWMALALPLAGAMPGTGSIDAGTVWLLIAVAAVLSIISLLLLSWAYARAEAQALVPLEYSMLLWAALFGWFAFGETPGWATLVGAGLIVCGCWLATRRVGAAEAPVVTV